jgi:hypothetical protein
LVSVPRVLGPNGTNEVVAAYDGIAGRRERAGLAGPDPRERFQMDIDFQISMNLRIWQDFEKFYMEI